MSKTREDAIARVKATFGMVPNMLAEMADSPMTVDIYMDGMAAMPTGTLTPAEQQAVILTISAFNGCDYCLAAHGMMARQTGLDSGAVAALKDGKAPDDARLGALCAATRQILEKRGWLDGADMAHWAAQGLDRGQLFEIVGLIGVKTISNYVNHMAHTRIDAVFGGPAD